MHLFLNAGAAAPKGWLQAIASSISALRVSVTAGFAGVPTAQAIASEIIKEEEKKRAQA